MEQPLVWLMADNPALPRLIEPTLGSLGIGGRLHCFHQSSQLLNQADWASLALLICQGEAGEQLLAELRNSRLLPPFTLLLLLDAPATTPRLQARPDLELLVRLPPQQTADTLVDRLGNLVCWLRQQGALRRAYAAGNPAAACGLCEDLMFLLPKETRALERIKGSLLLLADKLSETSQYYALCLMEQGQCWAKAGLIITLLWQDKTEAASRLLAQQGALPPQARHTLQLMVSLSGHNLLQASQTLLGLQQLEPLHPQWQTLAHQLALLQNQPLPPSGPAPYQQLDALNRQHDFHLWQLASMAHNWLGLPQTQVRRQQLNRWRQLAATLGPAHCQHGRLLAQAQQACYRQDYQLARDLVEPLVIDETLPATTLLFGASVAELTGLTERAEYYLNALERQLDLAWQRRDDLLQTRTQGLLLAQFRGWRLMRQQTLHDLREARQQAIEQRDFLHALQLANQLLRGFGAQTKDTLIALELLTLVWPSQPHNNQFKQLLAQLLRILEAATDLSPQQRQRFSLSRTRALHQLRQQMALRRQKAWV
ncbi:MAG: hypothetical protein LRY38_10620 [Aeromonadaceae bacterium]|nr:hypothetical protein [Aeromonadaceae bacterium]